jgi:hypothetical protein
MKALRCARAECRKNACNLTLMTRQVFFNLAVLPLLALLAFNTASIARSIRRIEPIDRQRHAHTCPVAWYLLSAPILLPHIATPAEPDIAAPLSRWTRTMGFSTEQECKRRR